MKTLTVKQPWASLIVEGVKDIENRTWPTKFRGRILIHASAKPAIEFKNRCLVELYRIGMTEEMILSVNKLPIKWDTFLNENGLIIGSVEIVDCVINHPSIWAEKTQIPYFADVLEDIKHIGKPIKPNMVYNWVLSNSILFSEPIPAKGKLSFWDYPNILAEPEEKNGELFCHCQLPVDDKVQVMNLCGEFLCRYCGGKWYR